MNANLIQRSNSANAGVVGRILILVAAVCLCLSCGRGDELQASSNINDNPRALEASAGKPAVDGSAVQTAQRATAPSAAIDHYKLGEPERIISLPSRLVEVSGVTVLSDSKVACVQDEEGVIFILDLEQGSVERTISFGPPGDYEGLTIAVDTLYVLRSDSMLFSVKHWEGQPEVTSQSLGVPAKECEGLCYDRVLRRLLVAPKSRVSNAKTARFIYSVDLASMKLVPNPAFVLDTGAIVDFARLHGAAVPEKITNSGKRKTNLRFKPAAIAIHPITSELFIVSSVDRVMVSVNRQGTITGYINLDPKLFVQPEGIAFLSSGDMIVTNEGQDASATLLRFKWRGPSQ